MSKYFKGIFTWENMLLSLLITIPYWIFGYPWQVQLVVVFVFGFAYSGVKATIKAIRRLHHKQPPQLEAPKSGLERIRDDYAEGTLTTEQMEQSIERELYAQAHAIEPPKPAPALPEPAIDWERERKRQEILNGPTTAGKRPLLPEPRNEILWRVKKYQEENTPYE